MAKKLNTNDMLINKGFLLENEKGLEDTVEMIKALERARMLIYEMAHINIDYIKSVPELHNKSIETEDAVNNINYPEALYDGEKIKINIPDCLPNIYIKSRNEAANYFKEKWISKISNSLRSLISSSGNLHYNKIFVWIKVFVPIKNFDYDNRYFKPVIDGIKFSGLVNSDDKDVVMFGGQGLYDIEKPHTEVTILGDKNIPQNILNL